MQLRPVRRPEGVIRRGLDQRVWEGDRPVGGRAALLEQPGSDRPFQWRQRLGELRKPPGLGQPAGEPEHGGRFDESLRLGCARLEPRAHERTEVGGRWKRKIRGLPKHLGHDLVENGGGVERAAARVRPDAIGRASREVVDAHRRSQLPDRGRVEPTHPNPRTVAVLDEAVEAREVTSRRAAARDHEGQHAVRLEATEREDERLQRRSIGPLRVIDEEQHRPCGLHGAEQVEERRADPDRIPALALPAAEAGERGVLGRRSGTHQLLDDPEGQQLLRLLATRLPHLEPVCAVEEPSSQRGLADARLPGEEHDARAAGPNARGLCEQRRELGLPPDERSLTRTVVDGVHSHGCTRVLPSANSCSVARERAELWFALGSAQRRSSGWRTTASRSKDVVDAVATGVREQHGAAAVGCASRRVQRCDTAGVEQITFEAGVVATVRVPVAARCTVASVARPTTAVAASATTPRGRGRTCCLRAPTLVRRDPSNTPGTLSHGSMDSRTREC